MQNVKNEHTDKTDVSYLQTVSRALKVLNLFETETALSLAAISSRLGVSKTIAYRLAHTLVLDGFLIQDSATKQYMLGDQVLLLGFCAVQRQAVKRIAHDLIWDFHERTKFSTYITIPCANQSLCVDRVVSDNTGRLSTIFVGGVYPLYRGASNRVLLAFQTERFREDYLRDLDIPEDEKQQLQQDLEKAHSRGYDCTHNTWTEGLFAVGFPIYDSSNQLVGGLSMGVVDDSKSFEVLERCISQGHLLAVEINNRMGSNYYSQLK